MNRDSRNSVAAEVRGSNSFGGLLWAGRERAPLKSAATATFTLIELLVVIAIIAILAGMSSLNQQAKIAKQRAAHPKSESSFGVFQLTNRRAQQF